MAHGSHILALDQGTTSTRAIVFDRSGKPVATAQRELQQIGATFLAGLGGGVYSDLEEIATLWRHETSFAPALGKDERNSLLTGWRDAVTRVTGLAS